MLTWAFILYAVLSLSSMAGMSIGAAVLIAALLFSSGFSSGPRAFWESFRAECSGTGISRWYFRASLLLMGACLLSLIIARILPLGIDGKGPDVHILGDALKLWYLVWPLILVTGLRRVSASDRIRVLRAWILALGVLSVIGIIQYFTGWPRPQLIPFMGQRYHATLFFGHHLSTASILIFPFFSALDFLRRKDSGILPRWLLAVICALSLVTLFFTYSRTLWVALPLGLLLWGLLSLPRRWAVAAAACGALLAAGAYQLPQIHDRFSNSMGFSERGELWKANLELFRERPITGVGLKHNQELAGYYLMKLHPGQNVFSGHAHNNALDFLSGTGVLGLLAWVGWFAVVVTILIRAMRRRELGFAQGLLCAWVVLQLNGLTQVNFWEGKVLHQEMWVIAWSLLP